MRICSDRFIQMRVQIKVGHRQSIVAGTKCEHASHVHGVEQGMAHVQREYQPHGKHILLDLVVARQAVPGDGVKFSKKLHKLKNIFGHI